MAARHTINEGQLQMFMTPQEIKANYSPNSGDVEEHNYAPDPEAQMWKSKRDEGMASGLWHSVLRDGVREPVDLVTSPRVGGEQTLYNGHHRVAAAESVQLHDGKQRYVPVLHNW